MAFLELLYVNKKEQDYFVYIGIAALLKLMTTYPSIAAYV
jgi:phosphate starvation-inducible membrane PsiE